MFSVAPGACSHFTSTESSATPGSTECLKCTLGNVLTGVGGPDCTSCPNRCSDCEFAPGNPFCVQCTDPSMSGAFCDTPVSLCVDPVPNCAQKFFLLLGPPLNCKCSRCTSTFAIETSPPATARSGDIVGNCVSGNSPNTRPNCLQLKQVPSVSSPPSPATTACTRCAVPYTVVDGECQTVSGCSPHFVYEDTVAKCLVADTNHMAKDDGTNVVSVPGAQQANSNCKGYVNLGNTFGSENARCGSCNTNYELDSTSSTKYECVSCTTSTPGITYCAQVAASEGNCFCRECASASGGKHYVKHPVKPGCVQVTDITNCITYTLKLLNGEYVAACKTCRSGVPSEDALFCVACNKICSNGVNKLNSAENDCDCECNVNFLLNSAGNDCIACGTAQISDCAIHILESNNCKCSVCSANYQLKTDKSGCVDCTTGRGTANCKVCSLVTPAETAVDRCTSCIDGYALNPAITPPTCLQCLPNPGCIKCTIDSSTATTQNKCTKCASGWELNNAGTCIQCPTSPEACTDCRIDPNDQTKALCLTFGCSTSSNALTDSDFTCESCNIANCAFCVKNIANTFKCLKCNRGHYMHSDGSCQACSVDCGFCQDGINCLPNGCKEGFIRHKIDGSCISCSQDGVARCAYETAISDKLIPKICKSGYKLNTVISPNICESKIFKFPRWVSMFKFFYFFYF